AEAARLFAGAAALRATIGASVIPTEQAAYDRSLDRLRGRLGESDFAEAWAAGAALKPDAAIARAHRFLATVAEPVEASGQVADLALASATNPAPPIGHSGQSGDPEAFDREAGPRTR